MSGFTHRKELSWIELKPAPKQNIVMSTVIWLFFSQLSKRDSIRWALAAVVMLLLKIQPAFTQFLFLLHSATILPNFYRQYSGKISLSHFQVLSVFFSQYLLIRISLLWIKSSLRNNSALFNLHFVGTIITLINLNNLEYSIKIRLCSQANQNHLF